MAIEWNDNLSVGVKEIDDQHKHFISILNEMYDAVEKLKVKNHLGHIIDELVNYAGYHFATEEKYFDMFNYENSEEHKAQHLQLGSRAVGFKQRFETEGEAVVGDFLDYLEDWLVIHLETQDKKYTKCFNEHGLH